MTAGSLQSNLCMEISVKWLAGSGPLQLLVRAADAAETYRSESGAGCILRCHSKRVSRLSSSIGEKQKIEGEKAMGGG